MLERLATKSRMERRKRTGLSNCLLKIAAVSQLAQATHLFGSINISASSARSCDSLHVSLPHRTKGPTAWGAVSDSVWACQRLTHHVPVNHVLARQSASTSDIDDLPIWARVRCMSSNRICRQRLTPSAPPAAVA